PDVVHIGSAREPAGGIRHDWSRVGLSKSASCRPPNFDIWAQINTAVTERQCQKIVQFSHQLTKLQTVQNGILGGIAIITFANACLLKSCFLVKTPGGMIRFSDFEKQELGGAVSGRVHQSLHQTGANAFPALVG